MSILTEFLWDYLLASLAEIDEAGDALKRAEDRKLRAAARLEDLCSGLAIHPGPARLAELAPQICDHLASETGTKWSLFHIPGRSLCRIWTTDGPHLQLAVDSFMAPAKLVVTTIWSGSGTDAWNNAAFAIRLCPGIHDPHCALRLGLTPEKIAREIAARVAAPAMEDWPAIRDALAAREEDRSAHDAFLADVAERLGQGHIEPGPDGDVFFSDPKAKPRWRVTVGPNQGAQVDIRLRSHSPQEWLPLIDGLAAAFRLRPDPGQAAPEEAPAPANDAIHVPSTWQEELVAVA